MNGWCCARFDRDEIHERTCTWFDPEIDDVLESPAPTVRWRATVSLHTKSVDPWYRECDHQLDKVTLADGSLLWASALHAPSNMDRIYEPDLAIYLDGAWRPACRAYHIGWRDFGTPSPSIDVVLSIAHEAIYMARTHATVEVGCLGGHGRTGTFLAICYALTMAEPNARKAISEVRRTYCTNAVESAEQAWYVACVVAHHLGRPYPPRPVPKKIVVRKEEKKSITTQTLPINGKRKGKKSKH